MDRPNLTTRRIKYPRTLHLPWSEGIGRDDIVSHGTDGFPGEEVVVTEKMDGENTTLYRDGLHARSTSPTPHPSRTWVRALHGRIAMDIPPGWRICGENLYARHSITYEDLPSYFMVFSIWNDEDMCLSWEETEIIAELLGIPTVPVLYRGPWNEALIRGIPVDPQTCEGYVVRLARSFAAVEFSRSVMKMVRRNHVQTDDHWLHQAVVPNKLKE